MIVIHDHVADDIVHIALTGTFISSCSRDTNIKSLHAIYLHITHKTFVSESVVWNSPLNRQYVMETMDYVISSEVAHPSQTEYKYLACFVVSIGVIVMALILCDKQAGCITSDHLGR